MGGQEETVEETQGMNSRSWVVRIVIGCDFTISLRTEVIWKPEQRGEALTLQEFSSLSFCPSKPGGPADNKDKAGQGRKALPQVRAPSICPAHRNGLSGHPDPLSSPVDRPLRWVWFFHQHCLRRCLSLPSALRPPCAHCFPWVLIRELRNLVCQVLQMNEA